MEEIENHLKVYLVAGFCQRGILKVYLTGLLKEPVSIFDRAHWDIASGLAGLHACSIVHGDLKLADILPRFKNGHVARLSDFGCSVYAGTSAYIGSLIYSAPEIRRAMSVVNGPKADFYASDIFSFGLVVWEIFQGGRTLIDRAVRDSGISWLKCLLRDDRLLQGLQAIETLPIQGKFPRHIFRAVLGRSLRDKPGRRLKCHAIVDIFECDRIPLIRSW